MFERFTDRARRVVVLAQDEARVLNHNYIGTEHILLGLVHEGEGVAAKALEELGVSLNRAQEQVLEIIGHGGSAPSGHIPFTPRARKVLELSLREALQLGHNYIGTEHILLGLIHEGEGVGAQVLAKLGADLSTARSKVIELLSGYSGGQRPVPPQMEAQRQPAPQPAGFDLRAPPQACAFCGRDVWEINRYVAAPDSVICDECSEAAQRLLTDASDQAARALHLPPRVFGDPPSPDAVTGLEQAVQVVFGGDVEADCAKSIEDGEQLMPLRAEARRRFPQITELSVHLWRVRFLTHAEAEIRVALGIGGGPDLVIDGRVDQVDGAWRIARETFCLVMRFAGIPCPPPQEPPQV